MIAGPAAQLAAPKPPVEEAGEPSRDDPQPTDVAAIAEGSGEADDALPKSKRASALRRLMNQMTD